MAMHGPIPKPPELRQRRNRPPELLKLPSVAEAALFPIPAMPGRPNGETWSPEVREWWNAAWTSPMCVKWLESDVKTTLYDVLKLRQQAVDEENPRDYILILKMIRTCEALLGFSPVDRLRLRWEIPQDEVPQEEQQPEPDRQMVPGFVDPRDVLSSVNGRN